MNCKVKKETGAPAVDIDRRSECTEDVMRGTRRGGRNPRYSNTKTGCIVIVNLSNIRFVK
jgi:hypothetical protein